MTKLLVRILLVLSLLLPCTALEAGSPGRRVSPPGRNVPPPAPLHYIDYLEDAISELDNALAQLDRMPPSRHRERVYQAVTAARTKLLSGLRGAKAEVETEVVVELPPAPMDHRFFGELLNRLKELSFGKDQLAYLKDASRTSYFVTEQVRQVMRVLSFGADKVEAAAIMYPSVLDKENFYRVQDELTFESDRDKLRERIGSF